MQRKPSRMALLQAIWLQAYKTGEVVIKFPDERSAVRTRLELYNSVKRVKTNEGLSPELSKAVNNCAISFAEDRKTLLIREKVAEDWLLEQVEAQGLDTRFLTEAPKTLAEAEAMARTKAGPSKELMRIQAEVDEKAQQPKLLEPSEPWIDPHAGGIPFAYGAAEPVIEAPKEVSKPLGIEELKSKYGFRGER